MQTRRNFLRTSFLAAAAAGTYSFRNHFPPNIKYPAGSPLNNGKRNFVSEAIESKIAEVKSNISDQYLASMFGKCFPNTLDTTVEFTYVNGKPDTFVITGDIHAMWLRDSSAQVWPYLPFTTEDRKLKDLIAGVINRQTRCILIDPYANAFNKGTEGSYWEKDMTQMKKELHERKWEIDSLCYPVRLSYNYYKITGDGSVFDSSWKEAMLLLIKTLREQQRINNPGPYTFRRVTSTPYDTQSLNGYGNSAKPVGLIHSMFRPSDDATILPFLIPSNMFAAVSLEQLEEIFRNELSDKSTAEECRKLSSEIREALQKYAIARHLDYGYIYCYEADGFGNMLFMDDANVPSLLSLPYLGCCSKDDDVYLNTRKFVLSSDNPYFFKGKAAEGIGGPHAGMNMIWPLGIIMRALTSTDNNEILLCLKMLKSTDAGTGFMHESFDRDDPANFTRPWFAWANTLFGELILKIYNEKPELLK